MKRSLMGVFVLALLAAGGCARVQIGTDAEPPEFEWKKWGTAYAAVSDIPKYNGTIIEAQMFRSGPRTGELASIGIWPLGFLDIGFLGLRGRLIAFEAGAGALFYAPTPSAEVRSTAETQTPK